MLEKLPPAGAEPPRLLNLFAYTGVASLLAAAAGAHVTHVDASKRAIDWAKENQAASGLGNAAIRWMLDDARKFAAREVRRGRTYHGILVDPPKFGRGPNKEVWEIFEHLPDLLRTLARLLDPSRAFLVLTVYAIRASSLSIDCLAREALVGRGGSLRKAARSRSPRRAVSGCCRPRCSRAGAATDHGRGCPAKTPAVRTDNRGRAHDLPLFMPVYQPRGPVFQLAEQDRAITIDGLIINAFFLYKQRELRRRLTTEISLAEFVGFDGLISTDSGAFQGFTRTLYLKNSDIVRFQDRIGSDIIAPLDLVTPPGDSRTTAQGKLDATNKRIREALALVEGGIVAGVQQGGRFLDLRERSVAALMEMEVRYVAIGSLVPFFNKNHDLAFAGAVIRKAREIAGPALPMHVYGAGDPAELPFFVRLGANVFDLASYGLHYARPAAST